MLLNKIKGETLIEVMMTVVVVLLAVTAAFKIMTMAHTQKNLTADRIIAIQLAREGMEAVRYIRDYNWMYYGASQRICWNFLQDNNNDGILDGSDASCEEDASSGFSAYQIGASGTGNTMQEYVLKKSGTHWFLTRAGYNGHSTADTDSATLTVNNIGINADLTENTNSTDIVKSYRLCRNTDDTLYVSCLDSDADTTKRTKFLRVVKVSYTADPTDASTGKNQNTMYLTVRVLWLDSGTKQDIVLSTMLTDFYQRKNDDAQN